MMDDLIKAKKKKLYCDSNDISTNFKIKHNDVVRTINRTIKNIEDFRGANGTPKLTSFINKYQGAEFICYHLDRRAFTIVMMRFSSKRARKWQTLYFDAFDAMERKLNETGKGKSILELKLFKKENNRLKKENKKLKPKAKALKKLSKQDDSMSLRDASSHFGLKSNKVFNPYLRKIDWIYKNKKGKWRPYAYAKNNGFLKVCTFKVANDKEVKQTVVLSKGLVELSKLMQKKKNKKIIKKLDY